MTPLLLVGCGSGIRGPFPSDPVTGTTGPTGDGTVSGNWQFVLTPAAGTPVLTQATGSLDQDTSTTTSQGQFTTGVLLVYGDCYDVAPQVPVQGDVNGTSLALDSFGVIGQFLHLTTTIGDNGLSANGSYSVSSGCAKGASGTVTGTQFAPLTGTYGGKTSGGESLSLVLKQSTAPAGDGTFLLGGTMTATGFSCFTTGATVTPPLGGASGSVSGPTAIASFVTNEGGSALAVSGTFDSSAKALTVTKYTVTGGACAGQTGTATLSLVP